MVIKGNPRGSPSGLAKHLERTDTNERMQVKEIRGVVANDLAGALQEMDAHGAALRTTRTLYHASINTRADERLTDEQRARAVDQLEEKLGLTGQARAVVMHEKEGRAHFHIVWARTDLDHMRAIRCDHNYRKHEEVARALEAEFGHARVQGAHVEREGKGRPARTPSHAEMQQAERTGLTPAEAKEQITAIWQRTDNGKAFAAALEDQGWILARGDKRDFVVIDPYGEAHSLARRVDGAKAKDVRERMADVDATGLPGVDEARAQQRATPARVVENDERAAVAAKRDVMQEPTEAEIQQQQQREQAQLREVEVQAAKVEAFRKQREAEIAEAQRQEKERREQSNREKELRAGDISDAGTRYSGALGEAGGANVYQTLANAALAEGAAFKKEQEALRKEAAAEKDPEKRALIDLRRQIEAHEYMALTSQRLAGISATLAGREDNPIAQRDREQAAAHQARAKELRAERSQRQAEQERREQDKAQQQAAERQAAVERYRAATGRAAPDRSDKTASRQAEAGNTSAESALSAKDSREAARAAYRQARDGTTTPGKEQPDGNGGKSTGRPSGGRGRGGGRGR